MSARAPQFAVYPGGQPGHSAAPGREYQELWFSLARLAWSSVVLVPADAGTSTAEIAKSLAEVGGSLCEAPVTAIVTDAIDYGSARALAAMQPRLGRGGAWRSTVEVEGCEVEAPPRDTQALHTATPLPPSGRAIIAIRPVMDEPLGLAIAQAADAVVLCVELGRSRLAAARRTIELVGADRVIGALVIR